MYIHLGADCSVRDTDIVGIFDMDTSTVAVATRRYLAKAEREGEAVTLSYELPKSFIVCRGREGKGRTVYISQISPQTLKKRSLSIKTERTASSGSQRN